MVKLVRLDLGGNLLQEVESGSLSSLPMLATLYLDGNRLSRLPRAFLTNSQALTHLSLANNPLVRLGDLAFSKLSSVTSLNLSSCSLTSLAPSCFDNLTSLSSLDLSWNRLALLPSSQLSPLTRASRLNLAGNSFQEVPSHALRSLQRLEQLDLSHLARLSQVQVAAFHNNLALRSVDLSHCPMLREVRSHAFPPILQLSSLSLAHTAITTLPQDSVPWDRLKHLDLEGTPLRCSCHISWMLRSGVIHAAVCASPAQLRGRVVRELSADQLGCGPHLHTEVLVVGLGCVALVALALVVASLCCLCRHRLRHFASTCTVAAREADYKSSYDNCVYIGKNYLTGAASLQPLQGKTIRQESEELGQLKSLHHSSTEL